MSDYETFKAMMQADQGDDFEVSEAGYERMMRRLRLSYGLRPGRCDRSVGPGPTSESGGITL